MNAITILVKMREGAKLWRQDTSVIAVLDLLVGDIFISTNLFTTSFKIIGKNCTINTDDCAIDPCLHGSTCIDGINSFTCQCVEGFEGDNCQYNIYDCEGDPCQNGGECFDGDNKYLCVCPHGFDGKYSLVCVI